jgi:hypothetical protein
MDETCSTIGDDEKYTYKIFSGKSEESRPLQGPRRIILKWISSLWLNSIGSG